MVYRSSNPALNPQYFQGGVASQRMTLDGTINKTITLLGLVSIAAMLSYSIVSQTPGLGFMITIGGAIAGAILALAILFIRPNNPQILMSMYALLEGLFIGGFSYMIENYYLGGTEGVVLQALVGTVAVFLTMLAIYKFGIIKPTEKFVLVVSALCGAIMIVYLFNFIMMFFGTGIPFLHSSGPIGIGISVVFITVAALMLIVDFGMIENGVKFGAPKNMEWYGAFGLVLTLVWLYIEMLKLIAKLRD
ncbi:MAG: Bax inhibitor-1/YccA family protein [Candidatus Poseidoniaceae archaeon]